ncbi:autotransporter-associated beta strand repeat-containing protein [Simkania sp.]|uniref:autotransporter-associated beta strand repeat-containing protein n=1 Tax=Simkania sp. TaxID=34094 RepID=UPI003B51ECAE
MQFFKTALTLCLVSCSVSYGRTSTWKGDHTASWQNKKNWSNDIPKNAGDVAIFQGNPEFYYVSTDSISIGKIQFNSSGADFTIASNSGTITFNNNGSPPVIETLSTNNGKNGFSAGIAIASPYSLHVTNNSASEFWFYSTLPSNSNYTYVIDGTGTVVIQETPSANFQVDNGLFNVKFNQSGSQMLNVAVNSPGTLQLGWNNYSIASLSGSGTIEIPGIRLTLSEGNFSGSIQGSNGKVRKNTTGTLVLTGNNSYSGGTTVAEGVLQGTTDGLKGAIQTQSSTSVVFDQSAGGTYAGVISGDGSVTKKGTGKVTFSGNNSYTGGTTVEAGTLSGTTQSLTGGFSIDNGAMLDFDQSADGTYSGGGITGQGILTKNGTGKVTLSGSGPYNYSGGTTVSGGILQGNTTSLQGNITNNANVTFDQTVTGTYLDAISGTGSLTKTGGGILILTGGNSYTGGTTVSQGTLQGNTTSLKGSILNNAAVTFNQTSDGTYSGVMSGSGSLTKIGTAKLTLTGMNSYSGGTTVTAGTLEGDTNSLKGSIVNNAAVIFNQATDGTYSGDMLGSGTLTKIGGNKLTLTGTTASGIGITATAGTLQGDADSLAGPITNNAAVIFNQATADGTYSGDMSGSGTLTKIGGNKLTLTGTTASGIGITATAGTLQGDTDSLTGPITNNAAVIFNQATADGTYSGDMSGSGTLTKIGGNKLTLTGTTASGIGITATAGTLQGDTDSLTGPITNNAAVIFNQATADGTYSGDMSGSGTLTKIGGNKLTLTGTTAPGIGVTVTDGTLQGDTDSLTGPITNNAAVIFNQATADGTYSGDMSGSGTLTKIGGNKLTLTGTTAPGIGVTVTDGTLQGDTDSLTGPITNNAAVIFNQVTTDGTYASVMMGSGSLTKIGGNKLTLTGANTYGGGTTVSGGTLEASITNLQGDITINSGATFTFNQATVDGTYSDNIAGNGTLTKIGGNKLTLTGTTSSGIGITVTDGPLEGDTDSLKGPITNNAAVIFNQATADGTYASKMSGSGSLTKKGVETLILTEANSYSGGTTIEEGILEGTTTSLQGPIVNNSTIVFKQRMIGTYTNSITGSGDLIKQGLGIITLSGDNTYAGMTTVNLGVLNVKGSIAGSATEVQSGAILHVNGEVKSPTTTIAPGGLLKGDGKLQTVNNSGIVWPGNSIGTLTIAGDFTQNANGRLLNEVNSRGEADLLIVTGTANLDGALTVIPHPGYYPAGLEYIFMTYNARNGNLNLTDPTSLGFTVFYLPSFALLTNQNPGVILPVPLSELKGNAKEVAHYLFCPNYFPSNPDLLEVLQAVLTVPADQFPEDLVKLSHVQFGALPVVELQNQRMIADVMAENAEKFYWCDPCITNGNQNQQCKANQSRTTVWVAPVGSYYDQGSIGGETDYDSYLPFDAYSVGIAAGANHMFYNWLQFGGAVGYIYSDIDWNENRGKGHWNSIYFGPSLGMLVKEGYVNLLVLGAYNTYSIDRHIHYPGVNRTAHSSHHSYDVLARVDGGYKFRVNIGGNIDHFFILPEARLSYLNMFENGYTESGADSINLKVDRKYSAYLQPTVLVKFLRDFYTPSVCITPVIQLGWISNIPLTSGKRTARFYKQTICESSFTVKSYHKSTNQFTVGGELVLRTNNDWIIELGYKADLFDNAAIQSGKVKVEKRF